MGGGVVGATAVPVRVRSHRAPPGVVRSRRVSLLAAIQHVRFMNQLLLGAPYRPRRLSLGVIVSALIAIIGGLMAVYLISYGF